MVSNSTPSTQSSRSRHISNIINESSNTVGQTSRVRHKSDNVVSNSTPSTQSSRIRHRSDSINERFNTVRQRIMDFELSARNSLTNTSNNDIEIQRNESHISPDSDVEMDTIMDSSMVNDINIERVLTPIPLCRNTSSSQINNTTTNDLDPSLRNQRMLTSTPLPTNTSPSQQNHIPSNVSNFA